jgi:hypothetical protein
MGGEQSRYSAQSLSPKKVRARPLPRCVMVRMTGTTTRARRAMPHDVRDAPKVK